MDGTPSEVDIRLLDLIQDQIPLVRRPFAEIGRQLGCAEDEVLRRLERLRRGPHAPVRQVSAIFDSKALGYQTTLVAAKVPEDRLAEAVAAINAHPGVSHNYRRDHAYNLWYTLATPPDSKLGLEKTAAVLHRQSGATATRLMPTLKLYKIGVRLKLNADASDFSPSPDTPDFGELSRAGEGRGEGEIQPEMPPSLTELDNQMIRVLQRDLPNVPEPFDELARQAGVRVEDLLAAAGRFAQLKLMRRYSAVLRHRELGFDANAMGVWVVPPERQDQVGRIAAGFAEVSHCYLRPTYDDWPYSIFTMIHTRARQQAAAVLAAIAQATGVTQYAALYSTQEYKKVRVRYFEPDIAAWEAAASG